MNTNNLVVIEEHPEKWFLSFAGSNPSSEDCIELSKDTCFWLKDKIGELK